MSESKQIGYFVTIPVIGKNFQTLQASNLFSIKICHDGGDFETIF